jgi:hypothetical protein
MARIYSCVPSVEGALSRRILFASEIRGVATRELPGLIRVALRVHNPYSINLSGANEPPRYGLANERPAAIPLTSDASPPEYAGRLVLRRARPPTSSRDLGRGDVALARRG